MNLSKENIEVLKKITQINPQMYLKSDIIGVSSSTNSQIVYYSWGLQLEKEFAIYDMKEFLNVFSLFENPQVTLGSESLTISSNNEKLTYRYASSQIINTPPTFEEIDSKTGPVKTNFNISKYTINNFIKHTSILKNNKAQLFEDKIISIDGKNPSSNTYEINVELMGEPVKNKLVFDSDIFFKIVPDDYNVQVKENCIIMIPASDNKLKFIFSKNK